MQSYLDLLDEIFTRGNDRGSRAGATRSLFGYRWEHDLNLGFPLLTTKKMSFKNIVVELLWFLKGRTDLKYLLEHNVHIWSADAFRVYRQKFEKQFGHLNNAYSDVKEFEHRILNDPGFERDYGDLGPIYGKQWRDWRGMFQPPHYVKTGGGIDQIQSVIDRIKTNPEDRRLIVTAWAPDEIPLMALPACHCMFQFYVHKGELSCQMYQRSADVILGVPYNIASYALLTHIIAHQTGLKVGTLSICFGDVHIYQHHMAAYKEQVARNPYELPHLVIDYTRENFYDYEPGDFRMYQYNPHPKLENEAVLSVGA